MNRRKFLSGLAMSAAVRTWPFRVYSFPTEIVVQPLKVYGSSGGLPKDIYNLGDVWYLHAAQLEALIDLVPIRGIRS